MKYFLSLTLALLLAACAGFAPMRDQGISGSLVEFLYPDGEIPPTPEQSVVHLQLPLTVGLAFVPSSARPRNSTWASAIHSGPVLSAALQSKLLERVRQRFVQRPYIQEIKVIPEAYLRAGQGFTTLEQLSRLYGFDVIALVSYDQVAITQERASSLLYWTIAGMYVVKGNRNDVHTFVDTAILDVRSRKLLFRAPGIDLRSFNSTLVENPHDVTVERNNAFSGATNAMIANLDTELESFRARVKQDESVVVSRKPGFASGGGAMQFGALAVLLLSAALRRSAIR